MRIDDRRQQPIGKGAAKGKRAAPGAISFGPRAGRRPRSRLKGAPTARPARPTSSARPG